MGSDIDWKNIGSKAVDIVAGVGGAVAGAYGGPAAASGVQTAGGAIKSFIDEGGGDKKQSRREQLDRQDFQARSKVVPPAQVASPTSPDEAITRRELAKLGYTAEQIDVIVAGPGREPTQTLPGKDVPVVQGESTKSVDWQKLATVAGAAIKSAVGTNAESYEGTNTAVLEKPATMILASSAAPSAKS